MKSYIKLLIAAIISTSFAALLFLNSFKLPKTAAKLPRILMALIVLFSIGIVIEGYVKSKSTTIRKKRIDEKMDDDGEEEEPGEINYVRAIIFTAMIAIYIASMKAIGYFIMTPIYIVTTYWFLKATKAKNMLIIAAGFTVFVYVVFVVFLKLPIPMGLFE